MKAVIVAVLPMCLAVGGCAYWEYWKSIPPRQEHECDFCVDHYPDLHCPHLGTICWKYAIEKQLNEACETLSDDELDKFIPKFIKKYKLKDAYCASGSGPDGKR